jgi:LDH2 family malate/lactate/ureidoglycolate dehydrogenase
VAGQVTLVSARELESRIVRILCATGVPEADAAVAASHLVEADLRGVHSHGTIRVPTYVRELRSGATNPRPHVRLVVDHGAQVTVDGDNGLGMVVAHRANDIAIERGQVHGMAAVAIRGSNHCGTMAYYTTRAISHGLVAIATTNAGINMTPTGSSEKLVGNNPISIAVPSRRPWPLVLDMATSLVAGGKLDVAKARQESIPLGWARDANGNPTTDPVLGRAGSLEPVGGPKGYGLAVMLDILAGVLSGGRFGAGLGSPGSAQFLMVLDVRRYMPLDEFFARIDALIDQLHGATRLPGVDRIIVAGELEYGLQIARERDGIPMDTPVMDAIAMVEGELGLG